MGKTIREACQDWVREMNAIPQELLIKAYPNMLDDGLEEITPLPKKYECDTCHEEFSQEEVDEIEDNENGDLVCPSCQERLDEDDDELECDAYIIEVEDEDALDYGLPMWGWLWNPNESLDEDWIRVNLQAVADCGFRIYESDEVGILLGIDGAGYDFMEAHWIPLYKARGLKWHDEE